MPQNVTECHGKGFSFQNLRRESTSRLASTTHVVTYVGAAPFALFARAYFPTITAVKSFITSVPDFGATKVGAFVPPATGFNLINLLLLVADVRAC